MEGYLKANSVRIFDFPNFSQPLTEQVRQNAQRIADENGIEIEFIRYFYFIYKELGLCYFNPDDLAPLYDEIVRTVTLSATPIGLPKWFLNTL